MKFRQLLQILFTAFLLLLFANPVRGQEAVQPEKQKRTFSKKLMLKLSDQDVILPITAITWGTPDRWSFNSRYIHLFEKDRDGKKWINSVSISMSPGLSGGRLGFGYIGILNPKTGSAFAIISEIRGVLLRTWSKPLYTDPNNTFTGIEVRTSLSGLLTVGFGYYKPISTSNGNPGDFYGFHVGIGF